MKGKIFISLVTLIPLVVSSFFIGYLIKENERDDNTSTYSVLSLTYEDKDVNIRYPNISGLGNAEKENLLNDLFKTEAFSELTDWSKDEKASTESTSLHVEYNVLYQSNNYLCVNYTGWVYTKNSAYPRSLFTSLNIDLNSGSRIQLSDIINIDNNFVDRVREILNLYIDSNPDWAIVYNDILEHDDDYFLNLFIQADSEFNLDCFSYFTKDYLGISFATSHAAGDHFEIELKFEDIKESIMSDNEIWKDLFL